MCARVLDLPASSTCLSNLDPQARGVSNKTKSKTFSAAGLHLGGENVHTFVNILSNALLVPFVMLGSELHPLAFVGTICVVVVLKTVLCCARSSMSLSSVKSLS